MMIFGASRRVLQIVSDEFAGRKTHCVVIETWHFLFCCIFCCCSFASRSSASRLETIFFRHAPVHVWQCNSCMSHSIIKYRFPDFSLQQAYNCSTTMHIMQLLCMIKTHLLLIIFLSQLLCKR